MPSCPKALKPQHLTPPFATSAHVWALPKAMAVAETPAAVKKGEMVRGMLIGSRSEGRRRVTRVSQCVVCGAGVGCLRDAVPRSQDHGLLGANGAGGLARSPIAP